MTALLTIEFAITAICCLGFVALFGNPNHHAERGMAWHVMVFTAATGVEAAALLAAARRLILPTWTYPIIFGAVAVSAAWRLALYLRPLLRRRRR